MPSNSLDELREKDRTVLKRIQAGDDDVQKITSSTILSNSEVNYCFRKLHDLDLIEVEKPDGMVERTIDGTVQVFEAPKKATLTSEAMDLEHADVQESDQYHDLSREDLIQKLHQVEDRVDELEQSFETFRKQVQQRL